MFKKIHTPRCITFRSLTLGCVLGASLTCVMAAGSQDRSQDQATQSSGSASVPGQLHKDAATHDNRDGHDSPVRGEPDNRDDARRTQEPGHADAGRHLSRMTPGERRDLRRQINEAGQDIYANSPHH